MNRKHVYFVDDNSSYRKLVEVHLQKSNFSYEVFSSPDNLLKMMRQETMPSIILTDLMMPGMDGIELIQEIKSRFDTSKTSFVVLSSQNDLNKVVQTMDCGADKYILKDHGVDVIMDHVFQAIHFKEESEFNALAVNLMPSEVSNIKIIREDHDSTLILSDIEFPTGSFINLKRKDEGGISLWRIESVDIENNKYFTTIKKIYENER